MQNLYSDRAIRGFRPDYRQGQPPIVGSTTIPIAIAEAKGVGDSQSCAVAKALAQVPEALA